MKMYTRLSVFFERQKIHVNWLAIIYKEFRDVLKTIKIQGEWCILRKLYMLQNLTWPYLKVMSLSRKMIHPGKRWYYCMFLNPNGTGASCYCPLSHIYNADKIPILLFYGVVVLTIDRESPHGGHWSDAQSLIQRLLLNVILPTQTLSGVLKEHHFKAIIHKLMTSIAACVGGSMELRKDGLWLRSLSGWGVRYCSLSPKSCMEHVNAELVLTIVVLWFKVEYWTSSRVWLGYDWLYHELKCGGTTICRCCLLDFKSLQRASGCGGVMVWMYYILSCFFRRLMILAPCSPGASY